jgi:hypothetical protein
VVQEESWGLFVSKLSRKRRCDNGRRKHERGDAIMATKKKAKPGKKKTGY